MLLCVATAGLTYGMVVLAKETKVDSSGLMLAKGSDMPVSTGGWLCCQPTPSVRSSDG